MYDALVITPVKDSIHTTEETIRSVIQSTGKFQYSIFNDFSTPESTEKLIQLCNENSIELVNLSEITDTPSPNYRLVLQIAQKKALSLGIPLIIVESDVEVSKETLKSLVDFSQKHTDCGMVASITKDRNGKINFPYLNFRNVKKPVIKTNHSLSFCCTLLTPELLKKYDFATLSAEKHWYDVSISRKSRQFGLTNYLMVNEGVLHKPHSSRPWKQLKYENPIKYYYLKLIKGLDRI